ncbi:alpha-glucosidase [Sphingorhabdus arenilitoris]|uniref:Alpha-glucosidase n=1 Tax=Sphingorhabdus arenilitoris TaxID=1490041 RepID=A0ABV8RCH1_9SPHN
MQFTASKDGFDLIVNGLALIRHRTDQPAFALGRGDPAIEMYRGNYRIEDSCTPISLAAASIITPTRIEFRGDDGLVQLLVQLEHTPQGFTLKLSASAPCDRIFLKLAAQVDEHIWGGGEQMSYLKLNGRRFPIWTSEPGVGRDKSRKLTQIMDAEGMAGGDYWTTNYPQPTFVSSHHYACHFDGTCYSVMDFSDPQQHGFEIWQNKACFHFFFADNLPQLVGTLSDHFGKPARLPDWVFDGAIIGLKDGERSFDRLNNILAAGTAVTGLWCEDWVGIRQTTFGRRLFWDWRWSADRYPNLPAQITALKEKGIRFLGYVNPYLAVDGSQYQEAAQLGYLALRLDSDEPYVVDFGEFDCGIVDFTNAGAARWFADRIIGQEMLDFGLSGWMADFGEYLPTDVRLSDGTDGMDAHNLWPVLWAKVNADAIAGRGQTDEAMFFMRAGFSGVQAHCPLLWAGDQCVDFSRHDGIGTVITAALSAGLVGNAVSHSDTGGYTSLHGVVRTSELFMRWAEMAAFSPVMRTHEGNRPDDNLQVDSSPEILRHFAAMSQLHAALAPYFRSLADEAQQNGLPLQRPMFLHYPVEPEFADCQDQYMLGADMIIAPVIEEGSISRHVMIPQDNDWINMWTGMPVPPGMNNIAAPIGAPPVFFRADSAFAPLFRTLPDFIGPDIVAPGIRGNVTP